jgi:hypothetical protein
MEAIQTVAKPNNQQAAKLNHPPPLTNKARVPHTSGFPVKCGWSTPFMRLSLMKAAHAALAGAAYRKSGYLARFSRDVGFREP